MFAFAVECYLKTILILLQIFIDSKKIFLLVFKKQFRIDDIKVKSFETLRNVFKSEMRRKNTFYNSRIRGFKTNYFLTRMILCVIFNIDHV